MKSRRDFLKLAGTGAFTGSILPFVSMANSGMHNPLVKETFKLSIAGYSFLAYKDDIDRTIDLCKAVDVNYVSLKDFSLPYNSTQEEADEIIGKFKAASISVYGVGVIYMKTDQDVDNAFAYAKRAGVNMIIASPAYDLLTYVEKKAKESEINIAIHNHGPEDKLFPDVNSIYDKIKNMDPVLGICMDIGHTFRSGQDPAAVLIKYHNRIYDMHLKDVDEPVKDGKTVINGMGKIDFVSFVNALHKTRYSGHCSLEFETRKDPAMGIAQSIGNFRGVLACVR
jgi:sugar phosphate isomerase/epimerase